MLVATRLSTVRRGTYASRVGRGKAVTSCATKIKDIGNKVVVTIEGLARGDTLLPVQRAWLELDVPLQV